MAQATIHASTVAFELPEGARALALSGPSGIGKSALALELMGLGARLVSDDQTVLRVDGGTLFAAPPPALAGLIEWRGVGLLPAEYLAQAPVVAWVDLTTPSPDRLPVPRWIDLLGQRLPCLHIPASGARAAGLRQYMLGRAWDTSCASET